MSKAAVHRFRPDAFSPEGGDFDAQAVQVAERFGVTLEDLKRKSRGQARKALAHLAIDDAGLTLRSFGE